MTQAALSPETLATIEEAAGLLRGNPRVLVFAGAGLSAESGISTFRGPKGVYNDKEIARLTHVATFAKDPEAVLSWYQQRRHQLTEVRPNEGHMALARLAATGHYTIATQNVDHLEEVACRAVGTRPEILRLHGSLARVRCHSCPNEYEDMMVDLSSGPRCKRCTGPLRPGVVWFGEMLDDEVVNAAMRAASECDVCLLVGTSALVYPAASLPELAHEHGAKLIEVNPEPSALARKCRFQLRGPAGVVLPALEAALGLQQPR